MKEKFELSRKADAVVLGVGEGLVPVDIWSFREKMLAM